MIYFRFLFRSLFFVFMLCSCGEARDVIPEKRADATFTNPIITADFSDPDVIRVGKDYYMTASSFYVSPGLPVLHSKGGLFIFNQLGHWAGLLDWSQPIGKMNGRLLELITTMMVLEIPFL